jgi:hypothetical protein
MQYNFEVKLGTLNSFDKKFSSTDIAILLNKAQDQLINERYSSKVGSSRHFEMDEKTRVELGKLISNSNITSFSTGVSNIQAEAMFANLPGDYLYSITEKCVLSYVDANGDTISTVAKVFPVTHDEYLMNINNEFNKPYRKLVWRMDIAGDSTNNKKHELIYGIGCTITSYQLRYLKRPAAINIVTGVDCELHVGLHEEIIDMAVLMGQVILTQKSPIKTQEQ